MWLSIFVLASVLYVLSHYIWPKCATVPLLPGHQPFFGYLLKIACTKDMWKFIQDSGNFSSENRGITKMWFPFCTFYHITDVDAASTILTRCLDKLFFYKAVEQIFGSILISAPVPVWKTSRHILNKAFKHNVLNGYLELFNHQATKLAEKLKESVDIGEVDLEEDIGLITLETSWQTSVEKSGMGNVDENLIHSLRKQHKIWTERSKSLYLLPNFIFNLTSLKKEQDKFKTIIDSKIQKAVAKSKENYFERKKNNNNNHYEESKFYSSLDIILENSVTDRGFLYSDDDLSMFVANLLLATFDTTNITMLYLLVCIGSDCNVQERVYHEIQTVVEDNDVTKEHLPKLVYLEAVIKEVVRLFPAGPAIGRQSNEAVKLKNMTIPKGGGFIVHLWAINRRKEYWGADADEFRPERWLDPATLPKPAAAFASFSMGQRNCIGKTYTINVMKTYLVHVLRKYRVSGDYTKIKTDFVPLLEPVSGHQVTLSYR